MIENDQVKEFYELTQMEVYSRKERKIADCLKKKLSDLGLSVYEDGTAEKVEGDTGNLIAVLKGDPTIEPIIFSSHMDRVPNNGHIHPTYNEEDGIIYSDKKTILAADDVSGLCVILQALRNIKKENIHHGDIEVCFSVCEEKGVLGSKYYDFSKLRSKKAFVFDIPGRCGRIVNQAPAKGRITVTVHGRTAHAGNEPEKGLNALRIAADLIMHLPDGRITPNTTTNWSIISAGSVTNVVCDLCTFTGEQRSTSNEEYAQNTKNIKDTVEEFSKKYNTPIEVKFEDQYKTFLTPEDSEIAKIAVKAHEQAGLKPFFSKGGGGMDGNHFSAHGISVVGVAPGYSHNHTKDEQLILADFLKCAEVATDIVKVVAEKGAI